MNNHFDWPFPQKQDTMYLSSISIIFIIKFEIIGIINVQYHKIINIQQTKKKEY